LTQLDNDLTRNIDKIHTTEMGLARIKRNLNLKTADVVRFCKQKIERADDIVRKGKNWYVGAGSSIITVNAHSYTIITAHKTNKS
jgi:hypothetical protein